MDHSSSNPELRDLKTHQAGATQLHETRRTDTPVKIEPAGPPGAIEEDKVES